MELLFIYVVMFVLIGLVGILFEYLKILLFMNEAKKLADRIIDVVIFNKEYIRK